MVCHQTVAPLALDRKSVYGESHEENVVSGNELSQIFLRIEHPGA